MSCNSIKLAGFLVVAFLLPSIPAAASGLDVHRTASVARGANTLAGGQSGCAIPPLSVRTDKPLVLDSSAGEAAASLAMNKDIWAAGAASQWNAGINKEVDHLINPPEHVSVFATQSGNNLQGQFEGTNSPNETLASFALVIH